MYVACPPNGTGADGSFHTVGPVYFYQTKLRPPTIGPLKIIE